MKYYIVLLAAVLLPSLLTPSHAADDDSKHKDTYESLENFSNVLTILQQHYVEEVDTKEAMEGAINGMLSAMDPHSSYLSPDDFRELQDETKGSFSGIGIEVTFKDGALTIVSPIEETPAARAGLQAGDQIIRVNGIPTKEMTLMHAVKELRGEKGTEVTISVYRAAWQEIRDFTLRRDEIPVHSVKSMILEPGLAYIRITNFQTATTRDFKKALSDLEKEGPITGLLLDLRNNPGGLLDQAVKIADIFLDQGIIVATRGRDKEQDMNFEAHRDTGRFTFPMVVLVNEGSASAAEIVAGALKDHGRAVIAGATTFGKGSVQTVIPMPGGAGLRLTTARYYTPSGSSIQATGIKPDIQIASPTPVKDAGKPVSKEPIREKDLPRHFENSGEPDKMETPAKVADPPPEKQPEGEFPPAGAVKANPAALLQADSQLRSALIALKSLRIANTPLKEAPSQEE